MENNNFIGKNLFLVEGLPKPRVREFKVEKQYLEWKGDPSTLRLRNEKGDVIFAPRVGDNAFFSREEAEERIANFFEMRKFKEEVEDLGVFKELGPVDLVRKFFELPEDANIGRKKVAYSPFSIWVEADGEWYGVGVKNTHLDISGYRLEALDEEQPPVGAFSCDDKDKKRNYCSYKGEWYDNLTQKKPEKNWGRWATSSGSRPDMSDLREEVHSWGEYHD